MVAIALMASGATTARADDAQKARELFTQGNTYFDLGQFDKAIGAWQDGYQLKNDPGFLYNIAQAYRTMGDAQKAIFFYKRYLSNSPKARNRSEVEQKIEALQKQLSAQEQARGMPPPGPFGPDNPGAAGTAPTEPAPASNPEVVVTQGAGAGARASGPGATSPSDIVETRPVDAATSPPRRVDLRAAIGFDTWSSGLQENAQPSFAFTLAGGYTFGNPAARFRFRLGALLGYTFLKETDSRDTFTSFLVDPTIVMRVTTRLQLMGDLGFGVLSIGGLTPNSALLASSAVNINGSAQTFSLVRLGVAADYDLTKSVSLFFWPAYANSAKKENFYANIGRFEILAGVAYRP